MKRGVERVWYGASPWVVPLLPFSALWCLLVSLRRLAYRVGLLRVSHLPVPVIVVGNIAVGGSGKTPLVVWLVRQLRQAGYHPGVVSRGYGGAARHWPQQVRPDSDPVTVGDEAVLIARRTGCPMAVGPDRPAAARALLEWHECDVIVSDDGLQHYALGREIEIAVVDGVRRYGNGHCLPAGPLREGRRRLRGVDFIVNNGSHDRLEYPMRLRPGEVLPLSGEGVGRSLESFRERRVHAVAGIGNPGRFFEMLRRHGLEVVEHPFPDHHPYRAPDLRFEERLPILMTEKDAVKCRALGVSDAWYLPVEADVEGGFRERLLDRLARLEKSGSGKPDRPA